MDGEHLAYAWRDFDTSQVGACPVEVGRTWVRAVQNRFVNSPEYMLRSGWRSPPANRGLVGIAMGTLGSKDTRNAASFQLTVSDFPYVTEEQFKNFQTPLDGRPEARPKDPPTYLAWRRQAGIMVTQVCSCGGLEHKEPINFALTERCQLHETNPNKYSLEFIRGGFDELWWAWTEEIKEEMRSLRQFLGKRETPCRRPPDGRLGPRTRPAGLLPIPTDMGFEGE